MTSPTARWAIEATIVLETAARLGVGDRDSADLTIALDEATGRPLLPGTTMAGLLRHHLVRSHSGDFQPEEGGGPTEKLFGAQRSTGTESQSLVMTFDSIANEAPAALEIRDGVGIDPKTGTAADHLKYDYEVIPAGTTFPIRVDLRVEPGSWDEGQLLGWLARGLEGLNDGGIHLGGKTSRGLGQISTREWRARRFDLTGRDGWAEWLRCDPHDPTTGVPAADCIAAALSAAAGTPIVAAGESPRPRAEFALDLRFDEPLLIASPGSQADEPDDVHLTSAGQPILSGTSVAGVLRHRAWTIAEFVADDNRADQLVDWIFGPRLGGDDSATTGEGRRRRDRGPAPHQSRLRVGEQRLTGGRAERRTRIGIDRFTGGVLDGLLFDQQVMVGTSTQVLLELRAEPDDAEVGDDIGPAIGLLVLVLRDVIDGSVSFGGNESVGYGFAEGTGQVRTGDDWIDLRSPAANDMVRALIGPREATGHG